jgi:hypothetical protein
VVAGELKPDRESAMRAGLEKFFGTDPEWQAMPHNSYKIWHRKPKEVAVDPNEFIDIGVPPLLFDDPVPSLAPVIQPVAANQPVAEEDRPPTFPDGGAVVAKGCLFASTNLEYLKVILDRLDSPETAAQSTIKDAAEYKEVDRIFGSLGLTEKAHFFQFFARTQETLRPTYEMIRLNQMAQSQAVLSKLLNGILSPDGERSQILDGTTMPEFEKVQHYFGRVGIYGITEENGYFVKGFALGKEE